MMPLIQNAFARALIARSTLTAASTFMPPLTSLPSSRLISRTLRPMSSAAAASTNTSNNKRRRVVEDKDPITVTPRAEERLQELLENQPDAAGIRLGVRRRGCNGLSYTLNYAKKDNNEHVKDIGLTTPSKGIHVWIEPMALFNIVGTTMDWEETELSSEFTFHNPNSKGSCGCGESFNV